jgi:hypothetical protein
MTVRFSGNIGLKRRDAAALWDISSISLQSAVLIRATGA